MRGIGRTLDMDAVGFRVENFRAHIEHGVPVIANQHHIIAFANGAAYVLAVDAEVFATITDNAIRHILDNRHPLARSSFGQLSVFTGTPGIVRGSVSECLGRLAVNRDTESSHIPFAIRSHGVVRCVVSRGRNPVNTNRIPIREPVWAVGYDSNHTTGTGHRTDMHFAVLLLDKKLRGDGPDGMTAENRRQRTVPAGAFSV